MTMNPLFFHHQSREEITKKAEAGYAVLVPLAATEQHGPHLPVYTDTIICEHVAQASVSQSASKVDVLVTPTVPMGCSDHHLAFGGTLSLSSTTYLHVLRDIAESLVTSGFGKIIFLNGHGGNQALMTQTVADLTTRHNVWAAAGSYWDIAASALQEVEATHIGPVPGHAGSFETALVLALQSGLVQQEQYPRSAHPQVPWMGTHPPGTFFGRHGLATGNHGFTDAPNPADAATGRRLLGAITDAVSDWLISSIETMRAEDK